MIELILIAVFALLLDFVFGDPKSRYHPTAWLGKLVARLVPLAKNTSANLEKVGGVCIVLAAVAVPVFLLLLLDTGLSSLALPDYIILIATVLAGGLLLKTTIAVRGMEKHANDVVVALEQNNLEDARTKLSMIVKRNTKSLDKNHVLSGVLESVSENTVDGITGPLFYFAIFGLPGAFVYRTINTIDAMIGYKTSLFQNIGWFGANCDKILNFLPARITGLVMILSAMILGIDWKNSYQIMKRDWKNTQSPNAGFPMAALAGALGTRFEKLNHYTVGEGSVEFSKSHVKSAIDLMKVTSIMFCLVVTIPLIIVMSYVGLWLHA